MLAALRLTHGAAPADLFMTALAALDLLADYAARAPVLVVADNARWLDRAPCDVLAFVARRLEFEPILLVAAIRDGIGNSLEAGLPMLGLKPLARPRRWRLISRTAGQ